MTAAFQGAAAAAAGAGGAGVLTLSGESIIDISAGARTYRAELRINADGTVDQRSNVTITQIDALTDWIIPNGAAPGLFEFRFVNRTGFAPNGSTNMVEDIWEVVGGGLIIGLELFLNSPSSFLTNFDLEVRDGAGPLIDTGNYTLEIEDLF